ncbi:MAG: P-loop NTPase [Fidelibacterota bacterium]
MEKVVKRDEILNLLRNVKYPGYSRDIVSFGMVKDIAVKDRDLTVVLSLSTRDEDKRKKIVEDAKRVLSSLHGIKDVNVEVSRESDDQRLREDPWALQSVIPGVKNTIAVASGKGGVGKSTVAVNIAGALASKGYKVGVLDCDIYGPSLPTIMGLKKSPSMGPGNKILPLERFNIKLMSLGFIIDEDQAVIWRGPLVMKMIQQFIDDIYWGELDYLILDLPPGTGDVQLTLVQRLKLTGAVIVTTPQDLALLDAKKGANMFRKVNTPVIGIVENMSYFVCPHCGRTTDIFSQGGGESESRNLNVPFLGKIPLDPLIRERSDTGTPLVIDKPDSESSLIFTKIADNIIESIKNLKAEESLKFTEKVDDYTGI